MRDIQKLNVLLAEFGARYSIANLKLPVHGAVGIRLRDGTELYLEHEERQGKLYAYTPVVALPKDDASCLKLFATMLNLNFLGSGVECGTLSVWQDSAIFQMSFIITELQIDAFDRSLQKLVVCRTDLGAKLKTGMRSETGKAAAKTRHSASTLLAALK
jgi:hypothetical protein